jgi:hypothetical protein
VESPEVIVEESKEDLEMKEYIRKQNSYNSDKKPG